MKRINGKLIDDSPVVGIAVYPKDYEVEIEYRKQ